MSRYSAPRRPPDDYLFAEEWPLRGIILSAQRRIKDQSTPDDHRRTLRSAVTSMLTMCSAADQFEDLEVYELLLSFMDDAFKIGMLAGDTDAFEVLRKEASSLGGKRGGKTRARLAEETWKPRVKALAISVLGENPDLSKNKLAEMVSSTLQEPGFRTIFNYLSELATNGALSFVAKRGKK